MEVGGGRENIGIGGAVEEAREGNGKDEARKRADVEDSLSSSYEV